MDTSSGSEEDFYFILPSNVKSVDRGNTSSQYRTTLNIPLNLMNSNRWEVGLVEMSFVNAIKTIHKEQIKVYTNLPRPRPDKKLPPIILQSGYITTVKKSDFISKDMKVIMAKIGDEIFTCEHFTINLIKNKIEFTIKNRDIAYIKIPLWLAYLFGFKKYYDEKSKLRKMPIDLSSIPKTFIKLAVRDSDNNKLKARYRGGILRTTGPKGTFPPADHFIMTLNYTDQADLKFEFLLGIHQEADTSAVDSFSVPPGYYKTPSLLTENINKFTTPYGMTFSHDEHTNRIHFTYSKTPEKKVEGGYYIELDANLRSILGFTQEGKLTSPAQLGPNLHRGIYSLFVYCDICREVRVGNALVPLLRTVNYNKANYGDTIIASYDNPLYVPVSRRYIDSIGVIIADDTGEAVPFEEGKTVLTLHFRKV